MVARKMCFFLIDINEFGELRGKKVEKRENWRFCCCYCIECDLVEFDDNR